MDKVQKYNSFNTKRKYVKIANESLVILCNFVYHIDIDVLVQYNYPTDITAKGQNSFSWAVKYLPFRKLF
jgi:hypothetical protein